MFLLTRCPQRRVFKRTSGRVRYFLQSPKPDLDPDGKPHGGFSRFRRLGRVDMRGVKPAKRRTISAAGRKSGASTRQVGASKSQHRRVINLSILAEKPTDRPSAAVILQQALTKQERSVFRAFSPRPNPELHVFQSQFYRRLPVPG